MKKKSVVRLHISVHYRKPIAKCLLCISFLWRLMFHVHHTNWTDPIFFWHFTNKFFLMRESRHALMLGWICSDILDLSLAVALKRNGHFNWCANVRLHTCIIIIIVSWHFSIYSIAFIACNYDPLNTFAKLIVKTLKCHFELHIKVNQTHFLFRLKGFFSLHISWKANGETEKYHSNTL